MSPEAVVRSDLLPTHLFKVREDDKLGILDVRVLLNGEIQIDMEIQLALFEAWAERSLFYLSKMYVEQIHKGEDYNKMKKCIHIGILDFNLFAQDTEYYSCFHIWEDTRRRKYTDKFELHIMELPKLAKYEYPQTGLLNWAKFLNAERKEELEMIAKMDDYMEKAYERLTNISADEEKRLEYEAREKALRDYNYLMQSNLKAGFEKGHAAGHAEGRAEGRVEGRVQGIIEILQEEGVLYEETEARLMQKFSISKEEVVKCLKKYWKVTGK